jgi:hypothetical protein
MSEQMFCGPHLARTGKRIPATHEVNGERMCAACFGGQAIRPEEQSMVLMSFLPSPDSKRKKRAEKRPGERTQAA